MHADVNGIRMGYLEEGQGPPVVWVHGFPFRGAVWQAQMDAFKFTHRVIAPDLRGFGESDAPSGRITMDEFADDLRALLERLGTGPVVLAGHSMGGYVALAFARQSPWLLKGLALVATRAGADTPEGAAARRATVEKVRVQGTQVVVDAMAPKMLAPSNRDPVMAQAVRGFMAPLKVEGGIGALLGMAERPDSTALLAGLSMPVLAITGKDDALIPASESERMAQRIPNCRLEILPDAGHLVAYEKPGAFNRIFAEWLTGIR